MTAITDLDIQQIKDLITAGQQATQQSIALLAEDITGIKGDIKEIKGDIKELRGDVSRLDKKIDVGLTELRGDIKILDTKLEEKTKNLDQRITDKEFFSRGISVGLTVTIVGGILLAFGKVLFFGKVIWPKTAMLSSQIQNF